MEIIQTKLGGIMPFSYDKLWKLLIDKKLKKTDLIYKAKISSSALAKMSKNEYVSLSVLDKICSYLNCDISDIVNRENES